MKLNSEQMKRTTGALKLMGSSLEILGRTFGASGQAVGQGLRGGSHRWLMRTWAVLGPEQFERATGYTLKQIADDEKIEVGGE